MSKPHEALPVATSEPCAALQIIRELVKPDGYVTRQLG